mmetsp:Transcript_7288/g.10175  ORF Transcript_7288/g.10175 Transcript_7288/m.10175 type:complete len:128 (+) Transcript_7288:53-436(+)
MVVGNLVCIAQLLILVELTRCLVGWREARRRGKGPKKRTNKRAERERKRGRQEKGEKRDEVLASAVTKRRKHNTSSLSLLSFSLSLSLSLSLSSRSIHLPAQTSGLLVRNVSLNGAVSHAAGPATIL